MSDEVESARYARTWATGTITGDLLHALADHVDRLTRERDSAREAVRELTRERDELVEALAWIRRKLNLPEDAKMFSGSNTIAGAMHCVCADSHSMQAYVNAYKCDDKQGEIARLTRSQTELVEALRPFAVKLMTTAYDSPAHEKARALVGKYGP